MLEKILAVERIVLANPYGISGKEIIEQAEKEYGLKIERKSIYKHMSALKNFLPITCFKAGHNNIYVCNENSTKRSETK